MVKDKVEFLSKDMNMHCYKNSSCINIQKLDFRGFHLCFHFCQVERGEIRAILWIPSKRKTPETVEISRIFSGGAYGARTRDLLTASHYLPVGISIFSAIVSTSVSTLSRDF